MGVKDTNAATAMDGILLPVDDHDQLEPQARNVPMERVEKGPKVRDKKVAKPSSQKSEAMFRPRQRAAIPQLLVLDDSQRSAETIRIRKSPFRIGRQEGDLIIPLDSQLSASHAEIFLKEVNGKFQWYLKDLGSTNGTYARVSEVNLKSNRTVLIGASRFRFEAATMPPPVGTISVDRTRLPSSKSPKVDTACPCLVPLDEDTNLASIPLTKPEQWIGRDPKLCSIVIDDAMVSPKHVRIFCDAKGHWHAQCPDAMNGLWTQIDEVSLDRGASFQCGEQRFQFKHT